MTTPPPLPAWINLAQPRLGAEVVCATDDFFAPKERLILPDAPVFIPGKYDDHGKWMDGWESRRRRGGGHDACIVRLGRPGRIRSVDIDTAHFTGNFPASASVDACLSHDVIPGADAGWKVIVPQTGLLGDRHNRFDAAPGNAVSHVRLNIFPDGGVARLRVYGEISKDWSGVGADELIDLAALENGGRPILANDEHFGRLENIIAPGRALNMGDGWETRRRRAPGHDWGIIELGHAGVIDKILVDTSHFKGNYPGACSLQASSETLAPGEDPENSSANWPFVLPEQKLSMDREHVFQTEIIRHEPVRFVRLNIYPDGGIARLRLMGFLTRSGDS